MNENMNDVIMSKKYWVIYLILGILATLLGIFFAVRPDASYTMISIFIIIFFLVSGVCGIVSSIAGRKEIKGWGASLALYILTVIAGILLLLVPGLSDTMLYIFTGVGFLTNGVSLLVSAFAVKDAGGLWVLNLILGILIILASFSIIGNPFVSFLLIAVLAAIGTISFGVNCIILAVQLKKM